VRHVLTFLHNIVGFKLVALLLTVAMGVIIFQLSGVYKGHALNVYTEIKATPPGIAMIIDQTGQPPSADSNIGPSGDNQPSKTEPTSQSGTESATPPGTESATPPGTEATPPGDTTPPQKPPIPLVIDIVEKIFGGGGAPPPSSVTLESNRPTVLTINTDIDFGTVFPEEILQGHFIVYLTGTGNATDNETWTNPFTAVTYNVTMLAKSPYKDMRPNLVVQRDPGESDIEPDNTANGTSSDYSAQGSLNVTDNDTGDKWFVTLEVPDDTGDYWIEIMVEVP
jgi:hypothetical protein